MAFISINDDHIFYNLRKDKWREWNRSSKIMKLERKWAKSRIASRCWIHGSSNLHILSRGRPRFGFVRILLMLLQFCLWLHSSKLIFGLLAWQHWWKSMLKTLPNTKWSSFSKCSPEVTKGLDLNLIHFQKIIFAEIIQIFEILVPFYNFDRKIINIFLRNF